MITREDIQDVRSRTEDRPVLSLYLNVNAGYIENQSDQPAWRIFAKNSLKDVHERAKAAQENEGSDYSDDDWKAIATQAEAFIEGYDPDTRTLVLLQTPDEQFVYRLPVTMENQFFVGKAVVMPLVWAMDEYERYVVVLVDSRRARILTAYLGQANSQAELSVDLDYDWGEKTLMPASSNARGDAIREGGNNRDRFDDMIDEHIHRFYKDVAEHLRDLQNELDFDRIVLAGVEPAPHRVRDEMHETLQAMIVDIINMDMNASEKDVVEAIRQPAQNYERDFEMDLTNEVIGFAKAQGRGALGYDDVLRAFEMQQVELLILPYPAEEPEKAQQLMRMALDNNSEIELVHGSVASRLKSEGGYVARLYYALPVNE